MSREHARARVEVEHGDLRLELEVDLGRPSPHCQNPSSPAFADPGDPAAVEIDRATCATCGAEVPPGRWPTGADWQAVEALGLREAEAVLEAARQDAAERAADRLEDDDEERRA